MMLVWWAVFFFAGAFFPGSRQGVSWASVATLLVAPSASRFGGAETPRILMTCFTSLIVLVSGSMTEAGTAVFSGRSRQPRRAALGMPAPVASARKRVIDLTDDGRFTRETRGLLRAMLIADRRSLPWRVRYDWRRTGTAHYLALSGLHLGLLAVPVFMLLTLAGARGIVRDFTALLVMSFYTAVAGRPGSLLRALSMLAVLRISRLAGVKLDPGRCVLTGAFLVCALEPSSLRDTGFILSFNAAAGVAFLGLPACKALQRNLPGGRVMRAALIPPLTAVTMSVCVQASMLPLLVRIFGFVPVAGPIVSVVMSLPVTFLLYGGFVFMIVGHLFMPLSALLLNAGAALADGITSRAVPLCGTGIITGDFDTRLYVSGLVAAALAAGGRVVRGTMAAAALLLVAVSFMPVLMGQGEQEGGIVRIPGGEAVLYGGDGGILVLEESPGIRETSRIVRELRLRGIREVGSAVVEAAEARDAGGISLLAEELGPEKVMLSPWLEGYIEYSPLYVFVREDTVLSSGGTCLSVEAPAVLPRRGAVAGIEAARLVITPLD